MELHKIDSVLLVVNYEKRDELDGRLPNFVEVIRNEVGKAPRYRPPKIAKGVQLTYSGHA